MAICNSKVRLSYTTLARWAVEFVFVAAATGCTAMRQPATPQEQAALPAAKADVPPPPSEDSLAGWLTARLPKGGTLTSRTEGTIAVEHTVQENETLDDIGAAYVELTQIYLAEDLVRAIREENQLVKNAPVEKGAKLRIPEILSAKPKSPAEGRLGWSETDGLRGVYLRAFVAARKGFLPMLDAMAARGMNLAVIDVKDANGRITYPSKVPLATEIGANSAPQIKNLSRTIEFAHARGIRVAMRIVCFADDLLSRKRGDLAVQHVQKRPLYIGWMDPSNETVQNYVVDLAKEAIEAGADEIQLDYVRYPVEHVENADFKLRERNLRRTHVIRDFVRKVHTVTQASNVPLSVDIFGIVAEGVKTDIENLGQDPGLLARECEALSPMVYPSHYPRGFHGYDEPGAHPELVRVGVSNLLSLIRKHKPSKGEEESKERAVVRPWIQGMPWHAPTFGPQYIADQVGHADKAGATGWMVWNPGQDYTATWQGVPVSAKHRRTAAASQSSESKSNDAKSNDTKSNDTKSNDTKSNDTKSNDTKSNDTKASDAKNDAKSSEPKSDEASASAANEAETK
jgi:hypothetical protein